jgi:putative ATP-dependent endonuclease of OLD family
MKLKTLKINNFRAINGENNIIQFNENKIVFIFGKNNIGKSSVLHAYSYFTSPSEKAKITDFYKQDINNNISIEATFIKEHSDSTNFNAKGLNKWVDSNNEVRFRKTWSSVDATATKETFSVEDDKYVIGGFGGLEPILSSALPNIIHIEAMPNTKTLTDWIEKEIKNKILKNIKEQHKKEYEEAIRSIRALQEKLEDSECLSQISNAANKYFQQTFPELELSIETTPNKDADIVKAFEKDFSVTIGEKTNEEELKLALEKLEHLNGNLERNITFDLHGHGLIRKAIINIIGFFKDTKSENKNIILFEEPELYLHPSNKRRFRNTLYKIAEQENYQILCVSHDPQLIDLSKYHTSLARFVKNENGETIIYQASHDVFAKDEETKNRMLMLNRFNPHVCETFFADDVILVEGDTEAIVLRTLLEKHYPEYEIFVLNTGSKTNMAFFMEILGHFKIRQHIIHDADERFDYESGLPKKNKDGSFTVNSSWTQNEKIFFKQCMLNNSKTYVHRYVSIRNFEHAHGYKHNQKKGKPLSAYEYADQIDINNNSITIVKFLKQIINVIPKETHGYDQIFLNFKVI